MAKNIIETEAMQHVIQVPEYLKADTRNPKTFKAVKIGETVRLLGRDQALKYSKEEFDREFGEISKFRTQIAAYLKKQGLRAKVVEDSGSVIIFANEIRRRE